MKVSFNSFPACHTTELIAPSLLHKQFLVTSYNIFNIYKDNNTSHYNVSINVSPQDSVGHILPPWDCHLYPCFGGHSGPEPASGVCCRGPDDPYRGCRVATNGRNSSAGPPGSAVADACAAMATDHIPWLCNWRVGSYDLLGPAVGLLGLTLKMADFSQQFKHEYLYWLTVTENVCKTCTMMTYKSVL